MENRQDILYMVIPCYNEQEVLPETSRQLKEILYDLMEDVYKRQLYLKEYGVYLAAAILACIPWGQVLAKKVDRSKPWVQTGIHLAAFVVFALAVTYMVKGTYNPFIYFNF